MCIYIDVCKVYTGYTWSNVPLSVILSSSFSGRGPLGPLGLYGCGLGCLQSKGWAVSGSGASFTGSRISYRGQEILWHYGLHPLLPPKIEARPDLDPGQWSCGICLKTRDVLQGVGIAIIARSNMHAYIYILYILIYIYTYKNAITIHHIHDIEHSECKTPPLPHFQRPQHLRSQKSWDSPVMSSSQSNGCDLLWCAGSLGCFLCLSNCICLLAHHNTSKQAVSWLQANN